MDNNHPSLRKQFEQLNTQQQRYLLQTISAAVLPVDSSRPVYSALRSIWLAWVNNLWKRTFPENPEEPPLTARMLTVTVKEIQKIGTWIHPPGKPPTTLQAAQLLEFFDDETSAARIMRGAGRRSQRGQPASKRHLALIALDLKCANPDLSLSQVTNQICPCGAKQHSEQCRQQLRQQINKLVKYLKQYQLDYTWSKINT